MKLYDEHILPHLIDKACGLKQVGHQRAALVPQARGEVLEVGFGSGLNLAHYDPRQVSRLWALEPSAGMRRKAQTRIDASGLPVHWLDLDGDRIPLDKDSVDTIVITYTLCTIPDAPRALQEMRRVLRPEGLLLFSEHGVAPEAAVRRWQDRLTPAWRTLAGGCHLNRDVTAMLQEAGFELLSLEAAYLPSAPRIAGYNYRGVARRKN